MTFKVNDIEVISGITGTTVIGTEITGTNFYGNGSALTGIPDTYVTGATFNGNVLVLDDNEGTQLNATIVDLSGVTFGGYESGDSRLKSWGEIYNDNNTTSTTIDTTGVPVKVNSVSFLGGARGFSMDVDNRLTYTAATTGQTFEVTATISGEAQSGSQSAQFSIYKNGTTEIMSTITETEWSSSKRSLSLTGTLSLGNGEYIELWTQNNTSNKNFEVQTWTIRIAQI